MYQTWAIIGTNGWDLVLQGNHDGWLIEQIRNESYTLQAGNKRYELANHLGNVLAVVSDKKEQSDGVTWSAVVISATDYFPFGMAMPGRSSGAYRYGFNGKETDPETGLDDFGARLYDNRLGRWLALDPLARKYASLSPYTFVANCPLWLVDPDGREIKIVYTDANNKKQFYIYTPGDKKVPDNAFVKSVVMTLDKLQTLGADKFGIIKALVANEGEARLSEPTNWCTHTGNSGGNIEWSPNAGTVLCEGNERRSPAMTLLHELAHSYIQAAVLKKAQAKASAEFKKLQQANPNGSSNGPTEWDLIEAYSPPEYELLKQQLIDGGLLDKDKKVTNDEIEDLWIILKVEAEAASKLGEVARKGHYYKTKYYAEDPFSRKGPTVEEHGDPNCQTKCNDEKK